MKTVPSSRLPACQPGPLQGYKYPCLTTISIAKPGYIKTDTCSVHHMASISLDWLWFKTEQTNQDVRFPRKQCFQQTIRFPQKLRFFFKLFLPFVFYRIPTVSQHSLRGEQYTWNQQWIVSWPNILAVAPKCKQGCIMSDSNLSL